MRGVSNKHCLLTFFIIFGLKMITFMLKVAIEDYCLVIWTLLLQLFKVLYALIIEIDFVCLFVLLLYVPSQQLWSLRDGQFT